MKNPVPILGALVVLLVIFLGIAGYQWQVVARELETTRSTLASTTQELQNAETDNKQLSEAYTAEKERNDAFEGRISDISGTVGKLDKLAQTDPQLLAKYSKVYFLNENYTPKKLEQIPQEYIADDKDEYFYTEALPFLEDMLNDAKDDGIDLTITSAYRSFDTQKLLKGNYKLTYGTGANAFSADQGYSEHQLGTTADFTTKEISNGLTTAFATSEAGKWLDAHAYRYGFILSYPANNSYYQYEPWHWRFVGRDLAKQLHKDDKHFYDLDQRDINDYLISLFD